MAAFGSSRQRIVKLKRQEIKINLSSERPRAIAAKRYMQAGVRPLRLGGLFKIKSPRFDRLPLKKEIAHREEELRIRTKILLAYEFYPQACHKN